jgi:hypothetical protein
MFSRKGAVGVIAVLFSLLVMPVAEAAGLAQVVQFLRSPLGRVMLRQTDELAGLSRGLIGTVADSDDLVRMLAARLGAAEHTALVAELGARIPVMETRLMMEATLGSLGDDVIVALRRIAGETISMSLAETGAFRFVDDGATMMSRVQELEARFLAAAQQGGQRFRPARIAHDVAGVHAAEFNISGADFRFADLQDLVASGGQLSGTKLQLANLSRAQLNGGNLMGASLDGALVEGANLRGAAMRDVSLRGASLRRANLAGADLSGADLRGADLTDTFISGMGFRAADDVAARFQGALFDAQTRLPFSTDTARRLGMIFVP